MVCRQCGTEIADKALICYRCGTATTEPTRAAAECRRRGRCRSRGPVALALLVWSSRRLFMGRVARACRAKWATCWRPCGRLALVWQALVAAPVRPRRLPASSRSAMIHCSAARSIATTHSRMPDGRLEVTDALGRRVIHDRQARVLDRPPQRQRPAAGRQRRVARPRRNRARRRQVHPARPRLALRHVRQRRGR